MPKKKTPVFTFEHDGKTHEIPAPKYAEVSGQVLRDAYLDGDDGETKLGIILFENAASPAARKALYAKPAPQMIATIRDWLRFKPSAADANLGESSASSD